MARGLDTESFKNVFFRRKRFRKNISPEQAAARRFAKETFDYIKKEGFRPQEISFILRPNESHSERHNRVNLQQFLDNPLSVNDANPTIEGRTYGFKKQDTAISPFFEIGGFNIKELDSGYKLLQFSVYQKKDGRLEKHVDKYYQTWVSNNSEHAFLLSPQGEITQWWHRSVGPNKEDRSKMRERILVRAQGIFNT